MDKLELYIECIANNSSSLENYEEEVYQVLSEIAVTAAEEERVKEMIPNLYELCKHGKLSKYYVYLSCMANIDDRILRRFFEYDKADADLTTISKTEIFEYVVYKRKHWFLKVLKEFDSLGKQHFNDIIHQKVLVAKLIEETNATTIDREKVRKVLDAVLPNEDEFIEFYKKEMVEALNVIAFMEDLDFSSSVTEEMFQFVISNSLLTSLSKHVALEKAKYWEIILNKLQDNDTQVTDETTQKDVFLTFTVICTILDIVTSNNEAVDREKELRKIIVNFFKITSATLQLEVIKISFIIIFLRTEHLKHFTEHKYLNDNVSLNIILQFLKSVFDTIKIQHIYNKESPEYKTFIKFNKYLADAMWRYELITHVKASKLAASPHNLIPYMLAPPESLIHLCLKQKDFERAQQVVKIFNLEDTYLAKEIEYCASFADLKELYKEKANYANAVEFLEKPSPLYEETSEQELVPLCLQKQNDRFMRMFDFAVTQCTSYEDSKMILNEAFKQYAFETETDFCYTIFCNRFKLVFENVNKTNKIAARNVLTSSNFTLNLEQYEREDEFFGQLETLYSKFENDLLFETNGSLNSNHESHVTFGKLRELCERFALTYESRSYLGRLFAYLKAFSKVLYIVQNNSNIVAKGRNCSFFEILHHNRALLIGKLLFENNLDPADFEETFTKLRLDLLYHIVGNCFPTINLHKQEIVSSEELYPENRLYVPTDSIMTYVQKRNWLLAYILSEMYKVHALNVNIDKSRIRHFANYMNLSRIQHLKVLFEGSDLITALQNEIDSEKLINFIQKRMDSDTTDMTSSYSSSEDSVENAEEMSEEHMKAIDWKYLYDIVNSIPENQLRRSADYTNLQDLIVKSMVSDLYEFKYYEHVQYICDRQLRIETILGSFDAWPVDFCIRLLTTELSRLQGDNYEQKLLETWIAKLALYKMIMGITKQESWYEIHKMCHEKPEDVIKLIIETKNIDDLQNFLNIFGEAIENLGGLIDAPYLAGILEMNEPFAKIENILNALPTSLATGICYSLLKRLKNIAHHQNVVAYLLKIIDSENDILKNIQISLKIISNFPLEEQDQLWCLITSPLSILEVLVMNTKLDRLGVVLEPIRADLKSNENEENVISTHNIDEMLRSYAEKSLDFRVVLYPTTRHEKLLESFDSATVIPEKRKFVMPAKVPSKEEWISNSEVTVCMCCLKTTFSMFSRRHHCRRCGGVVCYNCSQKRMLVETYGDILVRVCENCFEQTHSSGSSSKTESLSSKSLIYDFWLLTDNEEHNKIVREEFSYEHAPSVSLCLSILKHHSKTTEYPQFLLKQCENMLKLLHPRTEATHEIDHLLVIRMLKSLALAAKMSCSECMLHWGISLADKILSQADLLHLLVDRGCLGLLPVSSQSENIFIDTPVLRKLRDKLLEDEQWNLALEVSTKTGLDNTGVFAAWGKTCLKAGSLQLAREKFQRCFLKTPFEASSELETSFSVGRRLRTTSSSASSVEGRPKDPPLLYEIVQILETNTLPLNRKVLKKLEDSKKLSASIFSLNQGVSFGTPSDPAICILNKLKNLEAIAAGNYYEEEETEENENCPSHTPRIQSLFYEECIYYLQKYGSPSSLLRFFVKHHDYNAALRHVLDSKIAPDVFTEIYILCLKNGVVDKLHACMREMDPSLEIWKDYFMNICWTLEKQQKLHSLHQLQLFVGDYVRAAMTCIMFYRENARSFSELVQRENYLQQAELHLNQDLEQQQWVEVAAVSRSVGSMDSFEEKSITSPSLVMKISARAIGKHINTIWRQMELAKYLASCEIAGRISPDFLTEFLSNQEGEEPKPKQTTQNLPTLFDSVYDRIKLVVLAVISGETINEGFNVAQRIIQEFKLKPMKVYCLAGKQLAKSERYANIAELVTCINNSSADEKAVNEMCDEMLSFAVRALTNANASGAELEKLIKLINDKGTRISAYIEARQLKSAYFLGVKYKRVPDIRRIMREAELLNQPSIKSLCQKFLQSHSHSGNSQ